MLRTITHGCHVPSRRLPAEFSEVFVGLVQDSMLLFKIHFHGVLVRVAMEASANVFVQYHNLQLNGIAPIHLMPSISYHCTFLRESLQRVSRNEPSGLDVVFCKQFQETADSNRTGEEAYDQSAYNPPRHIGDFHTS